MKNRVLIYFFYDEAGIVDDYAVYFLKELTKVTGKSIAVVNGFLTTASRRKLENVVDEVICRENKGYDSWAYKEAIEHLGWEHLAEFDELLMVNYTLFGPFYPFEKVFEKMEASDADFWGLQRSYEKPDMKFIGGKKTVHGYMPEFPLSSFWVIRERLLHSYEFKHYWGTLHEIKDYTDACLYHEPVFAKNMCDFGFTMDTFLSEAERNFSINPTIDNIYHQVVVEKLPVIRRRTFFNAVDPCFDEGFSNDLSRTLKYVEENYDYDINLIHQNLLRTCTMYDLQNRMIGTHILCEQYPVSSVGLLKEVAAAIVVHSISWIKEIESYLISLDSASSVTLFAGKELESELNQYAESINLSAEKIFVDNSIENIKTYALNEVCHKNCKYIYFICENERIGRNEIENRNHINRYVGSFLQNTNTFYHAVSLLEINTALGILANTPSFHNVLYNKLGTIWNGNFPQIKNWMEENNITIPIAIEKMPVCSYNSSFLCRKEALSGIERITYSSIDSFKDETLGICVALLAQQNNFYTAYALNQEQAKVDLTVKEIMLGRINAEVYKKYKRSLHFRKLLSVISAPDKTVAAKPVVKYVEKIVEKPMRINPEEYLETLPTGMLVKKLVKKIIPKGFWNILRKKRYESNLTKTGR